MRLFIRIVVGIVAAGVLVYAIDLAWLRLRKDRMGSVQVRLTYSIPHKNGRVEYSEGGTETRQCVRSLFPHSGFEPCWYLKRHTKQQIQY